MKIKCLRLVIAFFLVQKFDIFLLSADGFFSKNTSLSFYANNAKTFATDLRLPLGQVKFSLTPENYNLGISAFSDKIAKSYPFCFKFGNLSAGGSLSKMNNPLLSTSTSPFSSGISSVNCITSSLPGYSSFSNPVSFFCQFSNSNKKSPLFQWKTNCFYSPEEENLAFSLHLSKNLLQKKLKLNGQITSGFFHYEENSLSAWFIDQPYYHQGKHFCSFYQFSADLSKFYSAFSLGIYENPFGRLLTIYRWDNKITTKHFIFTLSGLYNPHYKKESFLTSSEKKLENLLQLRGGLQYKFLAGRKIPLFIKTGLVTYANFNLQEKQGDLKFGIGSQLTSAITAVTLSGALNADLSAENPNKPQFIFDSATFKLKNTWYIQEFTPSFSASLSVNPTSEFDSVTLSSKFALGLNYSKIPSLSSSLSLALTNKDGTYTSKKLSGGITAKFTWKKINVTLKFSANIDI